MHVDTGPPVTSSFPRYAHVSISPVASRYLAVVNAYLQLDGLGVTASAASPLRLFTGSGGGGGVATSLEPSAPGLVRSISHFDDDDGDDDGSYGSDESDATRDERDMDDGRSRRRSGGGSGGGSGVDPSDGGDSDDELCFGPRPSSGAILVRAARLHRETAAAVLNGSSASAAAASTKKGWSSKGRDKGGGGGSGPAGTLSPVARARARAKRTSAKAAWQAALGEGERVAIGKQAAAAIKADAHRSGVGALAGRAERFFVFQAQRQARLVAARHLASPTADAPAAAAFAATAAGRASARASTFYSSPSSSSFGGGEEEVPWPRLPVHRDRLAAWMAHALRRDGGGGCSGGVECGGPDAVVACVLDTCRVLLELLHRHWLMVQWHSMANLATATATTTQGEAGSSGGDGCSVDGGGRVKGGGVAASFAALMPRDPRAFCAAAAWHFATTATTDPLAAASAPLLQPPPAAAASTAPDPVSPPSSSGLSVGDRVEVRDGDEEWEAGTVEAMEEGEEGEVPRVKKDGYDSAYTWDEWRRVEAPGRTPGDDGPAEERAAEAQAAAAAVAAAEARWSSPAEAALAGAAARAEAAAGAVLGVLGPLVKSRFTVWRACEAELVDLLTALPVAGSDDSAAGAARRNRGGGDSDDDSDNGSDSGGDGGERRRGAKAKPCGAALPLEAMAAIVAACQLFVAAGKDFCSDGGPGGGGGGGGAASGGGDGVGSRVDGCLRLACKRFFEASHASAGADLLARLGDEPWHRLPRLRLPRTWPAAKADTSVWGGAGDATLAVPSRPLLSFALDAETSTSGTASWDTGLPDSHPLSTAHVLTAEPPTGGSTGSSKRGLSGRAFGDGSGVGVAEECGLWCGAAGHAAVRRLVATSPAPSPSSPSSSSSPPSSFPHRPHRVPHRVVWPSSALACPQVAGLLSARAAALDGLWRLNLAARGSNGSVGSGDSSGGGGSRGMRVAECLVGAAASVVAAGIVTRDDLFVGGRRGLDAAIARECGGEAQVLQRRSLFALLHVPGANPFAPRAAGGQQSLAGSRGSRGSGDDGDVEDHEDDDKDDEDEEDDGGGGLSPQSVEEVAARRAEAKAFGTAWVVTGAALDGVAALARAYVSVMVLLPQVKAGLGGSDCLSLATYWRQDRWEYVTLLSPRAIATESLPLTLNAPERLSVACVCRHVAVVTLSARVHRWLRRRTPGCCSTSSSTPTPSLRCLARPPPSARSAGRRHAAATAAGMARAAGMPATGRTATMTRTSSRRAPCPSTRGASAACALICRARPSSSRPPAAATSTLQPAPTATPPRAPPQLPPQPPRPPPPPCVPRHPRKARGAAGSPRHRPRRGPRRSQRWAGAAAEAVAASVACFRARCFTTRRPSFPKGLLGAPAGRATAGASPNE